MSRKQLMEHVVPIVLRLKATLEAMHSPLLKDTMAFLHALARNYRFATHSFSRWAVVEEGKRGNSCDLFTPQCEGFARRLAFQLPTECPALGAR